VPLTSFVGRDAEIAQAVRLLEYVRLLTLTGPGGTGKTRLALQVAARVAEQFRDGVRFVSLAPIADPDLVVSTIAGALGFEVTGVTTPGDALAAGLANARLLLVLDNLEQVVDASPAIADLLIIAPEVRILATSRIPLRVSGEQILAIPSLELPVTDATADVLAAEAVALFVQRAQAGRPDFSISDDNAAVVAAICRRVDALPLAIELAAARTRTMSPQAVLERLTAARYLGMLPVLAEGPRDAPIRQRSLRATIAWSYDLLAPSEKRLMRQLSIFVGGWTIEGAEAVCDPDLDVFSCLATLTEHSLVHSVEQDDAPTRFDMLETIREFALEQLQYSQDQHVIARRHATFVAAVVEQTAAGLHGPRHRESIRQIEREIDNLRAAWDWVEQHAATESDLGICLLRSESGLGLAWFWFAEGRVREGRQRIQSLLAVVDAPPAVRAAALNSAGLLATELHDVESGWSLHQEALALARATEDRLEETIALWGLGRALDWSGDDDAAIALYMDAIATGRSIGTHERLPWGLWLNPASILFERREYEPATALTTEALEVMRRLGDDEGASHVLSQLAEEALRGRGDVAAAADLQRQSLGLHLSMEGSRSSRFVAQSFETFARIALAERSPTRAARLFGAADAVRDAIGIPSHVAYHALYDQLRSEARRQLGDAAWEQAWLEGRTMSVDRAAVYALEESPPEVELSTPDMPRTSPLSPREVDVLRLIATGQSNQQIAATLFISQHTVANHVASILNKLGVDSRAAAAAWAARQGIS
jgi:non-specific serine/threonine protein kinase